MTKPENPPAFPVSFDLGTADTSGMTLRDWFAGQALATDEAHGGKPWETAEYAYRVADAMLEARAKGDK